jgi:exosortase A-associated hydrolase 1
LSTTPGHDRALVFTCGEDELIGVLTLPDDPGTRGVLVLVGGPQYRIGSHRQFLYLAHDLRALGFAVMRFDYRGMGDSSGRARTFESIDEDVAAAVDCFFREVKTLKEVVLWGLCDGASAAMMYAHKDPRVTALALVNPWVRSPEGLARAIVKHYYIERLLERSFWQNLVSGGFHPLTSAVELWRNLTQGLGKQESGQPAGTFQERMAQGLQRFKGKVLFVLSGKDLTAREFEDAIRSSNRWRRAVKQARVEWRPLPEADHTFSRKTWREDVGRYTAEWLNTQ